MSSAPTPTPAAAVFCKVESPSITVGEIRTLSCPLGAAAGTKYEFSYNPGADAQYDIQFLDKPAVQNGLLAQNFTSYKVGTHTFEKLKLKVDDKEFLVSPFNLEVRTVINETIGQSPTPFPIIKPEKVPIPWWWWTVWGIVVAALVGYLFRGYLKRKKRREASLAQRQTAKLSPHEEFQMKMRKLESKGYHSKGEFKLFALELTNIIKKTIGEQMHFPAEDLTSEEMMSMLERLHKAYFNAAGTSLTRFLGDLDQIKFAKIETDTQKCADLLDRGMRIGNAIFGRFS